MHYRLVYPTPYLPTHSVQTNVYLHAFALVVLNKRVGVGRPENKLYKRKEHGKVSGVR